MIAIIICWLVIFFALYCSGHFFVSLYNKFTERKESYGITEIILIGLSFITLILTYWSFFLPSNDIFLFILLALSSIYSIVNWKKITGSFKNIKNELDSLTKWERFSIYFFLICFVVYNLLQGTFYDCFYYHHQAIAWNEYYPVIPGLANIEHRFGFNSTIFLTSAIYTLRFLFGEPLYQLQGLITIVITMSILMQTYLSRFEIRHVIVFFLYIIMLIGYMQFLNNTSTDVLPNMIVFFLVSKYILNPASLKKDSLFLICIPPLLLTMKLSMMFFVLLSFYILYLLIQNKEYKAFSFGVIFITLLLGGWCSRNVILSGYLAFPIYQIDFFNFDWETPKYVLIKEKEYISSWSLNYVKAALYSVLLKTVVYREPIPISFIYLLTYIFAIISTIKIVYNLLTNKNKYTTEIKIIIFILLLSSFVWAVTAPDMRFAYGVLLSLILIFFTDLTIKKTEPIKKKWLIIGTMNFVSLLFALILIASIFIYKILMPFDSETSNSMLRKNLQTLYIKPYYLKDAMMFNKEKLPKYYLSEDICLYVYPEDPKIWATYSFDELMVTQNSPKTKYLDYRKIELRGKTLKDGFRVISTN